MWTFCWAQIINSKSHSDTFVCPHSANVNATLFMEYNFLCANRLLYIRQRMENFTEIKILNAHLASLCIWFAIHSFIWSPYPYTTMKYIQPRYEYGFWAFWLFFYCVYSLWLSSFWLVCIFLWLFEISEHGLRFHGAYRTFSMATACEERTPTCMKDGLLAGQSSVSSLE